MQASGAFGLTLPASIAGSNLEAVGGGDIDLSDENCTGNLTVSSTGALGTGIDFSVDSASQDGDASPVDLQFTSSGATLTSLTVTAGGLLYVNSATTISGQQTCIANGSTLTSNVNLALKSGYNSFNVVMTITGSGGTLNITTGTWPSRWIVSADSAVPLSLGKNTNVPKTLERQVDRLLPWK